MSNVIPFPKKPKHRPTADGFYDTSGRWWSLEPVDVFGPASAREFETPDWRPWPNPGSFA